MPTPSSHGAPEPASFGSTCPEDQVPCPPTIDGVPLDVADANNMSSASVTARPSTPELNADMTDARDARNTRETRETPETRDTTDASAPLLYLQSPTSMPPPTPPPTAMDHDDSDDAGARTPRGDETRRFSMPESDSWQPDGAVLSKGAPTPTPTPTSPMACEADEHEHEHELAAWDAHPQTADELWYESFAGSCHPSYVRPQTSAYLHPGSRFAGTQQSERQVYDVQVEIKHVDLGESFLCGYLRIQGLTEDHPTLTTYFEGEIVGSKHGFNTQQAQWGATERIDLTHWARFGEFERYQAHVKKGVFGIKDHLHKEHLFMRWKEHFLVPNHRVRTIHGASFEGFYYICFNQLSGKVDGVYFHSKSEKYQWLALSHVDGLGCMSAVEYR